MRSGSLSSTPYAACACLGVTVPLTSGAVETDPSASRSSTQTRAAGDRALLAVEGDLPLPAATKRQEPLEHTGHHRAGGDIRLVSPRRPDHHHLAVKSAHFRGQQDSELAA